MKTRTGHLLTWLAVLTVAMLAMLVVGCGSQEEAASPSPSDTSGTAMSGTALERMTAILGHEPTGLAKTVADRGTLQSGFCTDYPPFAYIGDAGEYVGMDIDVANEVVRLLNLKLEVITPGWDSIPPSLDTGRLDVAIADMTNTAERRETLDFPTPYYWSGGQLAVGVGQPQITTAEEMAGKKIGVSTQSTHYYWVTENVPTAKVMVYPTEPDAFKELELGRVDAVLASQPVIMDAINSGAEMEMSGDPLYYENASFTLTQNEADWKAVLNYCIDNMRSSGFLKTTSEQWINGLDLTEVPPEGTELSQ